MKSFLINKSYLYLKHRLKSKSSLYLHSPFVFQFYNEVIKGKPLESDIKINNYKKTLLEDNKSIEIQDFGAGSKVLSNSSRKIKDIARHNSKDIKQGSFMSRLVRFLKPNTILEYGTSLGISSLYMGSALNSNAQLISMEGDPQLSEIAQNGCDLFNLKNIQLLNGEFDTCFPEVLQKTNSLDLVYFDGNHLKEPTLKYFQDCINLANEDSAFVFDDIRWTADMLSAWNIIKAHPKVSLSIDLFDMGIIFFRQQAKENFCFNL